MRGTYFDIGCLRLILVKICLGKQICSTAFRSVMLWRKQGLHNRIKLQEMKASFRFLQFYTVILPSHDARYIGSKKPQLDTSKGLGRGLILRVCEESQAHQLNRIPRR